MGAPAHVDLRPALLGVLLAGLALAGGSAAFVFESGDFDRPGVVAVFGSAVGLSYIGVGLFAWLRRPDDRFGPLMTLSGFLWLLSALSTADQRLPFAVGVISANLFFIATAHLVLAFPSGRIADARERLVVYAFYGLVLVLQLPIQPLIEPRSFECEICPRNIGLGDGERGIVEFLLDVQVAGGAIGAAAIILVLARHWRASSATQRSALAPVLVTGVVVSTLIGAEFVAYGLDLDSAVYEPLFGIGFAALLAVPYAFLVGLARARFFRGGALTRLVGALGSAHGRGELRDALAAALGDPRLALAYWLPESERFVDVDGMPVQLPPPAGAPRVTTEVRRDGRLVGAIVHDAALAEDGELVRALGGATALAIENDRLAAELRANLEELRASRARIVEAGDQARRKLERDLHDGAQQRFVALALELRRARTQVGADSELEGLIDAAEASLGAGLDELRELARGIHPAVLSERGLEPALRTLVGRCPVEVELAVDLSERLPEVVESALYFTVAEALTNVVRYARASRASVSVARVAGVVTAVVRDDGIGGARIDAGSGLRGLADRLAAVDGRLEVESEEGSGTVVTATVPA